MLLSNLIIRNVNIRTTSSIPSNSVLRNFHIHANNVHQISASLSHTSPVTTLNSLFISTKGVTTQRLLPIPPPTLVCYLTPPPLLFSHKCSEQHHRSWLLLAAPTRLLLPCCQCSPENKAPPPVDIFSHMNTRGGNDAPKTHWFFARYNTCASFL